MQISADQLVGKTLGDYQIQRLLDHSELGAIYLAKQGSQGRTVTMMVFNLPEGISAQEYERFTQHFVRERADIVRLQHPNILPVYDFSEQSGYPYLVTAFVNGSSLSQVLKQQGRLSPQQTLGILKQLATGLDFAHSIGITHGTLSSSNILMNSELTVQIGGYGLKTIFDLYRIAQSKQTQSNLVSSNGIFLGSPAYIAPEQVLGIPSDTRVDIYALGVILFELLSGTLPFNGANASEIALKRLQQPVPAIHALSPDIPEAFDLLIGKCLEQDPARRYQHAGEVAIAFDRVIKVLDSMPKAAPRTQQLPQDSQLTMPPTVNWFEEEVASAGRSQFMPNNVSKKLPSVAPAENIVPDAAPAANNANSIAGVDPIDWWSANYAKPSAQLPPVAPGTFGQRQSTRLTNARPNARRKAGQQDRRKLIAMLAIGTVSVGVVGIGGINLVHLMQSASQNANQQANGSNSTTNNSQNGTTQDGNTPAPGTTPGTSTPGTSGSQTPKPNATGTTGAQPTATKGTGGGQPTPTATSGSQPTPTQQPPTPTPTSAPSHTGTVIGYTNMAAGTAKNFTNPTNGRASVLVCVSAGSFSALDRECTHEPGNYVNYTGGKLVCPNHGAAFSASSGAHLSGPGSGGLAPIAIRVNADGTITTG